MQYLESKSMSLSYQPPSFLLFCGYTRPPTLQPRAYLYLDEAHSIGCMGASGKGLCEHAGVDPRDVDVLMGQWLCVFWREGGVKYVVGSVYRRVCMCVGRSSVVWTCVISLVHTFTRLEDKLTPGSAPALALPTTTNLAGTFTKSFGSAGGYIAGSKQLVAYLRRHCPAHLYATSMAPGVMQQIISAIKLLQVRGVGLGWVGFVWVMIAG